PLCYLYSMFFLCHAPSPTPIYTLSLHDALPICFFLVHSKRPDYNLVFTQSAFFFWRRKGFVILHGTSQSFYGKRLFPSFLLTNPIIFDLIRASLCLPFQPHVAMSTSPVPQIQNHSRCLLTL